MTARTAPRRQRVRKGVSYTVFLFFPIFIYYLSPFLSVMGATQRIVTGSIIVFGAQFVMALFLGRSFCGWVCPAGTIQEVFQPIRDKPLGRRWARWGKWVIWVPWLGFIVYSFVTAPGEVSVDFTAFTTGGISVADLQGYIIYYAVLTLFLGLSLTIGRRGGCHAICWMAPFLIIGRAVRNLFGWPALKLKADTPSCIACGDCTSTCPMSLPVESMVRDGKMEHNDCILCGNCADGCRKKVIRHSFSRGIA